MRECLHWIRIGLLAAVLPLCGHSSEAALLNTSNPYKLNTSNPYKLQEYQVLFGKYEKDVSATRYDIHEIDADPVDVVVHKASQVEEGVLVDDTSLDVDGKDIGVKIRWLQHLLASCVGKPATWRVLIAQRQGNYVYVYEGKVEGEIVAPRGEGGYSFDPFFQPQNRTTTLAEDRPPEVSARALAVQNLIDGKYIDRRPIISTWDGAWQQEIHYELVAG